jgi:hypothetical protein
VKLSIIAIACLLTIEVSARLDDVRKYGAPFWGPYSYGRLLTVDEKGIRRNVPNTSFEKWRNNSSGFRGPDISAEKPPGVTRIVCMGTSETYGLYENSGKEWPAQLQAMLDRHGNFQVINSSVVGMPLHFYRPYLEKRVVSFKPDMVILYVNPYPFILRMERSTGSAMRAARPLQDRAVMESQSFSSRGLAKIKLKLVAELKRQFPSPLLTRYRVWKYSNDVYAAENRLKLKGKSPKDIVPQSDIVAFRKELRDLVEYLKRNGTKVVLSSYPVLIEPGNLGRYYDIFLETRTGSAELSMSGLIDAARKINHESELLAAEMGVGYVDSNRAVPKTSEYFADNLHYTDAGAGMVAAGFAGFLVKTAVTERPMESVAAGRRPGLD